MKTVTAVASATPEISGKDIATHTVLASTKLLHIGLTALADVTLYAGAQLISKIDKTKTVQSTVDKITENTDAKLLAFRQKLSGYAPAPAAE